MPWKPHTCPFCGIRYVNKTGLRNHLNKYVGSVRLPADGIHDVLEIEQILDPSHGPKYRCPYCKEILKSKEIFDDHLRYAVPRGRHSSADLVDLNRRRGTRSKWPFPFKNEEIVVWEPRGSFRFLDLPAELRIQVYRYLFCFKSIEFGNVTKTCPPISRDHTVYLQHNPPNNLLSILVTCCQIYHEARYVFFSHNRFNFTRLSEKETTSIMPFVIGIGYENAKCLRDVTLPDPSDNGKVKNVVSALRCHLGTSEEKSPWNDKDTYRALATALDAERNNPYETSYNYLSRLNSGDESRASAFRYRYTIEIRLQEEGGGYRQGTAVFELIPESFYMHKDIMASYCPRPWVHQTRVLDTK